VDWQFLWMKQYGIHGVALRRFGWGLGGKTLQHQFGTVLSNVKAEAVANHRGFFIVHDAEQKRVDAVKEDWQRQTGCTGIFPPVTGI
jgi:hypothetical protein